MCGLVGIASPTVMGVKGVKVLSQALYADQLRGLDSTGVALIDKDNNLALYKRALAASDFLQTRYGEQAMHTAESAFVALGHNRATTIGKTSNKTAHPFHYGRYVGAHNGTIAGHRNIFSVSKHPVDSMNFMDSLDKDGDPVETLKGIHTGAYAISVYDFEEQQLLFARNDERPLSLLILKDSLMWGSEASMLYWLADRNGLLCKDTTFLDIKPNTLYTYCCNEMKVTSSSTYTPKSAPYLGGYGSGWGKGGLGHYQNPASNKGRRSYAHGGTQLHKYNYDFSLANKELEEVLQLTTLQEHAFMPTHFDPYNTYSDGKIPDEAKGKCIGYVYCPEDDAAFPAIYYGAEYKKYQSWLNEGVFVPANIKTGFFTKDGNLTSLNIDVCSTPTPDIFDDLPTFYAEEFDGIWERFASLARTYCVSKKMFVTLQDRRIMVAYDIVNEGYSITAKLKEYRDTVNGTQDTKVVDIESKKKEGQAEKKCLPSPGKISHGEGNVEHIINITSKEVPGPCGKPISVERFMELTEKGCGVCASVIYVEDAHDMAWDIAHGEHKPVCPNCTSQMYKALKHRETADGSVTITRKVPAVN